MSSIISVNHRHLESAKHTSIPRNYNLASEVHASSDELVLTRLVALLGDGGRMSKGLGEFDHEVV